MTPRCLGCPATLAYNSRFRHSVKPTSEEDDWAANWYSFDYGPVHVIFLSSEHSKYENDIARQAHWLEQNLQVRPRSPSPPPLSAAVCLRSSAARRLVKGLSCRRCPACAEQKANVAEQRRKVPWIVVVIHRPLHNSPPAGGYNGGMR